MLAQAYKWKSYFGEHSIGVWEDETYFAAAFQEKTCIRLDIQRKDERSGLTWDDLRQIKNECGFSDYDGIEFYPRENDVLNTGNFRHLYLFSEALPLIIRK